MIPKTTSLARSTGGLTLGLPPSKIIATKFKNDDPKQGVVRTRPVCPYPQVATYKGSGSVDQAGNFACASPN